MKKKFNANNLFVGRMMYTSSDLSSPVGYQTDIKYIFEAKDIKDKFFKEVFSGKPIESEYSAYSNKHFYRRFDRTYIIDIKSYTDYFPGDYGDILTIEALQSKMNQLNGIEEESTLGR